MIGNNRMSGAIPAELGKLRYLETLFIDVANFQGPIPSALGNVTTLRSLAIYRNSLTGTIPKSLGQLSNVGDFLISANFFTGSLPPQLGNLTNVRYLNVRGNLLTGSIPSDYGRLKSVTRFFAFDNDLSGEIPAELGNCSSLAQIWLSQNRLSGRIPEQLGRSLTQLASLSLDHNDLSGTIPESLSNCTHLQDLNLGYNQLRGNISPAVASLREIVKSFSMPRNLLVGHIPVEIGGMMLVTNIDLAGNLLSGQIPASMGGCVEVLHLNLSDNRFEGQVPLWLRSMITLTDLDLSNNQLSGSIPPYLGNMVTLLSLNVSYNRLSGPIPNEGVFRNLTAASFHGNEGLCGPILGIACPAVSAPSSSSGLSKGKRLAIIFSALGFVGLIAAASVFCSIRARGKWNKEHSIHLASMKYFAGISDKANRIKSMSTTQLYEATGGFGPQNIVGSGKTATVYRGCLPDGLEVAIKRFKDDMSIESFHGNQIAELRVLAMTRHRNLVRVLGYCNSPGMAALVMEMMPNGTLATQIQEKTLDWETLLSIAMGVANGLLYLHKEGIQPILHCDLKPSNILLDFDLKPAIADFGLSRILKYGDISDGFSTSNIRGSIGYMAPEYAACSKITSKVDVYSYGILLLEMVSGRSPTCEMFLDGTTTLRQWVVDAIVDDNGLSVVAPQFFQGDASSEYSNKEKEDEMIKVLHLGLACSSNTPQNRPTMGEVVHILSTLCPSAVPKREDSPSPPSTSSSF
jgi:Leucine-rich repeat (LRR) protein